MFYMGRALKLMSVNIVSDFEYNFLLMDNQR